MPAQSSSARALSDDGADNTGLQPRQPAYADITVSSETAPAVLAVIAQAFDLNVGALGVTPNAALWKDAAGMTLRFEKLAAILEEADPTQPVSINDFGCGYGALYTFLKGYPFFVQPPQAAIDYAGFDISEKMVAAAHQIIDACDAIFVHSSRVTRPADYTFVSGTFNFKFEVAAETWTELVKANLADLWANTRKGLAFNMLSAGAPERDPDLY